MVVVCFNGQPHSFNLVVFFNVCEFHQGTRVSTYKQVSTHVRGVML
jgi:hypothetical protein